MLSIDGSYGEGGGQIVRTAVALSVITHTPIEISNIRANRPNPGLRPQHYTAIACMKSICNATTDGLVVGSKKLTFIPGKIQGGTYRFDIGTAGSIPLAFQTCILGSLQTTSPLTLTLTGGTDVKWAPSWDYFVHVFLPLLQKIGIQTKTELHRRGYYPKGGGNAIVTLQPCKKIVPPPFEEHPQFINVEGIIPITSNLPEHIASRIKHAALKIIMKKNLTSSITIEETKADSEGTGITLWSSSTHTILGSTVLGEKGVSAESVGTTAAAALVKEIEAGVTHDIYAVDQLIPYLVLARIMNAEKSSCTVRQISNHIKTNIWLIQRFFTTVHIDSALHHDVIHLTIK